MDRRGRAWELTSLGVISPGQSVTMQRNHMPMCLDDDGDELALLDANNQRRDEFTYSGSHEDVWIQTDH